VPLLAHLQSSFGSKAILQGGSLFRGQATWDRLDAETEVADADEVATPEGAINLLLRPMPPETAERDATSGLLLSREDIRNPVLRSRGASWGHCLAEALGRRLSKDRAQGKRLGWLMARLWQGAYTWWAFTREEPPEQAIREALEEWIVGKR
jgi:hypothetical protein